MKTIDPKRIAKIERNYTFVIALRDMLADLEKEAMYANSEKQSGLRRACARIRHVMDLHVE